MSILRIRDVNGNVKEILALKGEPGKDGGLTPEVLDVLDSKADVSDIGSAKETFAVTGFSPSYYMENGYYTKDYTRVSKDGCIPYEVEISAGGGTNTHILGKTLKVKTYAYGDMACVLWSLDLDPSNYTYSQTVYTGFDINPTADVVANPESGVCEFEITVPMQPWGEPACGICFPFCDNPYTELEIYEKKGTVWEEIKNLNQVTIVASGVVNGTNNGNKWYYRKWGDGFTEIWSNVSLTFRGQSSATPVTGEYAIANLQLPVTFNPVNFSPSVQCTIISSGLQGAPNLVDLSFGNYSSMDVVLIWPGNTYGGNNVACKIYIAGQS